MKTMFVWKNHVTTALLLCLVLVTTTTLPFVESQSTSTTDPTPESCDNTEQQQCESSSYADDTMAASPSKSSKESLMVTEQESEVTSMSGTEKNTLSPNLGHHDDDDDDEIQLEQLQLAYAQIDWLENDHQGMFAREMIQIKPVDQQDHNNNDQLRTDTLLGLFAKKDIPKDTVLMKIPRSMLLTGGEFPPPARVVITAVAVVDVLHY
jgi:hypothetical protein